jgi:hypothetical protein
MTQTLERPVTDTTESTLDEFAAICNLATQTYGHFAQGKPPKQCERPAKWAGFTPCCGTSVLVCDEHRKDHLPLRCAPCNNTFADLIGWQPL